jgi:hypothetical protein
MVAIIAVRISLSLTLIRLKKTRAWTRGLYCFMAVDTVIIAALVLASLLRCRPFRAAYDDSVQNAHCFSATTSLALVYTTNGK